MTQSVLNTAFILTAFSAANLPWLSNRFFWVCQIEKMRGADG